MLFNTGRRNEWDDAIDAFEGREGRPEGTDRFLRTGDPEVAFERREFLEKHPWRVFRAQLEHRVERTETRGRLNLMIWFSGLGLATSVAVALLMLVGTPERVLSPASDPNDGIRTKGPNEGGFLLPAEKPSLIVKVNGQSVGSRAEVSPRAELSFLVSSGSYDHVLVFGVERDGALSPYYPEEEAGVSLIVGRARGMALPDSVKLNGDPASERIVAVFSSAPLRWSEVRKAAQLAFERGGRSLEGMRRLEILGAEEVAIWLDKSPL